MGRVSAWLSLFGRTLGRGRFGPVECGASAPGFLFLAAPWVGAASAPLNVARQRLKKESAVKPGSVLDSHSSKDARRRATLATYPEAHVGHM